MLLSSDRQSPPEAVVGRRDKGLQRDTQLRRALLAGRFEVRFQPIFEISGDGPPRLFGYEALTRGAPGTLFGDSVQLFDTVRQEGRERPADRLCMSLALGQAASLGGMRIAINVHVRTLAQDPTFAALLRDCCARNDVPLTSVILELIEHHLEGDLDSALRAIAELRRDGLALALDDLGQGSSALQLVRDASPEFVKLDRRMLLAREGQPDRRLARLAALEQVAARCGARAIAEGVETEDELRLVREAGVAFAQGFLLGRPQPCQATSVDGAAAEVISPEQIALAVASAEEAASAAEADTEFGRDLLHRLSLGLPGHAMLTLDGNGVVADWNAGAEELLGQGRPGMRGRLFASLFENPQDLPLQRAIEVAEATGCWQYEGAILREDGEPAHCLVSLVPLNRGGRRFAALIHDISALRVARIRAIEHQTRLELLNSLYNAVLCGTKLSDILASAIQGLERCIPAVSVTVAALRGGRMEGCGGTQDGGTSPQSWVVAAGGESVLFFDSALDPRNARTSGNEGLPAALIDVPVFDEARIAAVVRVSSARPRVWTPHEAATVSDVGRALSVALAREVEEIRRAALELELRQSRERLQRIADALPGAVYQLERIHGREWRLLFVSAGAYRLFDLLPGQDHTNLETLTAALLEQDRPVLRAAFDRASASNRVCTVEFRVRTRGGIRWLQLNAEPEAPRDDGGQVWTGLIIDISEIKAVQADLSRTRREWSATVDSVRDMIVLEDSYGRIVRCNLATSRFLRQPFQALVGLDHNAAFFGPTAAGTTHPGFRSEQATLQFPGYADWFEVSNYPLHDVMRRDASWVHVITNVTERRRFEDEANRLLAAVDQTGEMLLIVSRSGRLQYANPAYCTAAGLPAEELIGLRAFRLPLAPRQVAGTMLASILAGRRWHGTFSAAGPDGSVHEIEMAVSPVRTGVGETTSFVCVARDVTEPRRLEAIADAVNMVDQVGFVFASLRHELGNPVNSIKTALSVLHQNLPGYSQEAVAPYLERTLEEVARMEYLLLAFKTFGAFERPRLEDIDAATCLEEFTRLVRTDLVRRNVELVTVWEPGLGNARVDPRALNQALLNLVTNAADAVTGVTEPRVKIAAQRRGRRLEVRIEDNGEGVAEADLPNLFRPFFTTKSGGTGLGLAIVRKLLSKMGSTIEVQSQRGVGTAFTLSLPISGEAA